VQYRRGRHDGWLHDVPELRRFEVRVGEATIRLGSETLTDRSRAFW
jgi:hypothetical protein